MRSDGEVMGWPARPAVRRSERGERARSVGSSGRGEVPGGEPIPFRGSHHPSQTRWLFARAGARRVYTPSYGTQGDFW
jgi:hypothetical protein